MIRLMKFKYFITIVMMMNACCVLADDGVISETEQPVETTDIKNVQWPTLENLKDEQAKDIYDRPYSLWESHPDNERIKRNTGTLFVAGAATMGILYLMPESFTNWDNDDDKNPFSKWWDNVSRAPVWDKDDLFLNYVTHPYCGAVYYMGARSAGAGATYSFFYSAALSTLFWEYGIESFAERPSIQDLIVTPVFGSLLGEGFYRAKRNIRENDYEVWGSKSFGKTLVFLMDPITEVTDWIYQDTKPEEKNISFTSQPFVSAHNGFGMGYGAHLKITF